ncbi:MAG: glycosyltransferase [Chitinophagaceae bacterium]
MMEQKIKQQTIKKQNNQQQLKGKRILVATISADGHFNPLTGLGKYLLEAGVEIRWYTSGIYRERLENLGIPHYPLVAAGELHPLNIDELHPQRKLITDAGEKANFDMTLLGEVSVGYLEDIIQIRKTFPFDLVITDSMFPAIPLIKAKLKLPVLAIGIMPLAEQSVDTAPFGTGLYPPQNEEQAKAYAEMRDIFNNVVLKGSIESFAEIMQRNGLTPSNVYMFDTLVRHADLYLQIGSPSFEYKRSDLGTNIRFIGSLLPYTNPVKGKKWFDEKVKDYNDIVLVTQGTVERDIDKILVPTLEAFKNSNTLIVATTGGWQTKALQERYPYENMIIEDFIPFDDVMQYATVFVTNGGYSGALLGIKHKIPMVAAGVHEGKSEICARIGYFRYGINLNTETPTADAIRDAVNTVISDASYMDNVAKLSDEMQHYDAKELCVGYILELLN